MIKSFIEDNNLQLEQKDISFINIPLECDLELFINPFTLNSDKNEIAKSIKNLVIKYFEKLIDFIIIGEEEKAIILLEGISEKYTKGTHIGYSKSKYGKSIGKNKAEKLYKSFRDSEAIKSGLIKDIEDSIFIIPDISHDIISDIIIAFAKRELLEYTKKQCLKYGIDRKKFSLRVLNDNGEWVEESFFLPYNQQNTSEYIVLIPKDIIRYSGKIGTNNVYNYMYNILKEYNISNSLDKNNPNYTLSILLKSEKLEEPVTKKEFKNYIPYKKETIIKFFKNNPEELIKFKNSVDYTKIIQSKKADEHINEAWEKLEKELSKKSLKK